MKNNYKEQIYSLLFLLEQILKSRSGALRNVILPTSKQKEYKYLEIYSVFTLSTNTNFN